MQCRPLQCEDKSKYVSTQIFTKYASKQYMPGSVAQSVTGLATDAYLTADPEVTSSIRHGPILSWRLIMK